MTVGTTFPTKLPLIYMEESLVSPHYITSHALTYISLKFPFIFCFNFLLDLALSTKTTEDLSPPEHLLSATQSKVDEAREQQQRRHTTSHSDDAAPHGQQRRHPASRNHDAAPHKALSSSNPLSVVETELSSGAPLIASQTNDSRAPLRR